MKKNITIVLVFVLVFGGLVSSGTSLSTLGFAKAFRDAANRYSASIANVFSSSPAYADSYGYGTGDIIILPSLGTISVTDVTRTSVTLHSTIVDTGNDTINGRGFDFGITSTSENTSSENGSFSSGEFSASITGLLCGQTYFYEAFARNSLGTVWYTSDAVGPNAVFHTADCVVPTPSNAPWIDQTSIGSRVWQTITSSFDGLKLAAAADNADIFTSIDAGVSWVDQTDSGARSWRELASSADGTRLVAIVNGGDNIYTSADSGATWIAQLNSGNRNWRGVASSADGLKLAAVVNGGGYIYTSTDGGVNWLNQISAGNRNWQSIASSADGSKLAAADLGGYMYTSGDFGATWTPQIGSGARNWISVASSSDGVKLAAIVNENDIFTSIDSGVTWTDQTTAGAHLWRAITISDDGMKLSAVANDNYIYISTDGGATWTYQTVPGNKSWHDIAASADGTKFAAAPNNGDVWTKVVMPTVVTNTPAVIGASGAILSGGLSDRGNTEITTEGFEFGTTTAYGTISEFPTNLDHFESGTLGLLAQHTTYHYRAYAVTAYGTVYGSDVTFKTLYSEKATTLPATTITTTSAVFNGIGLGTDGPVWTLGFDYGLTDDYGSVLTAGTMGSDVDTPFTAQATNLSCGQTYHVRAFVSRTNDEQEQSAQGVDTVFTTNPCVTVTETSGGGGGGSGGHGSTVTADINKDGRVDILDYVILMASWGKTGSGNIADLNQDGTVDVLDMVTLMINWTK